MKTLDRYSWLIIITGFFLLQLLVAITFPNIGHAMSPEGLCEACCLHDTSPQHFWRIHYDDNSAYALYQRHLYLGTPYHYAEPVDYPFYDSPASSEIVISKTIVYKSKFVWYSWKKYTKQFDSLNQFTRSLDNSFGIRNEFAKDLKRVLLKNNK